jgi:hypothetical protein
VAVGTEVIPKLRFAIVAVAIDIEARLRLKLALVISTVVIKEVEDRYKLKLVVIAAGTEVSSIDQVEDIVVATVEANRLGLMLEVAKKASKKLKLQIGTSATFILVVPLLLFVPGPCRRLLP